MRLLRAKLIVSTIIIRPSVGRLIGLIFRDRIPLRGCVYDTSDACVDPTVKAMMLSRGYESAELRFIERYLRHDLDVVELGASLGVVTCQIARRLDVGKRLVAVEANAVLVPTIRRNLARNAPDALVTIVNAALHYGAPTVSFEIGSTNLSSHVGDGNADANGGLATVPAVTLGALLKEHSIKRYTLVADIEGAEIEILLSDRTALAHCEQLIIELHEIEHQGARYSVDAMCAIAQNEHGLELVDRYGPVCVFRRRTQFGV